MRKIITFLAIMLMCAISASGKEKTVKILGSVHERESKLPIIYASVELLSAKDSSVISGTITNDDGTFEINKVALGNYLVRASYISYKDRIKKVSVTGETDFVDLGKILLRDDNEMLAEAVVVAEVAPVVVKEDTTVFNAEAYKVSEGAMLEDLVKKMPGVQISEDGKLTVNGKEIKKIMIDGKEFFTDDPKIALKNLPANMVKSAKTYDKKSDMAMQTGIDDDEEETVLDLSVKKGMKDGWVGNLFGGIGNKNRYDAGGIMNRFSEDMVFSVIASANNTNNTGFSEFGDMGFKGAKGAGAGITESRMIGATFAKKKETLELGGNIQYGYSDNDAKMESFKEMFLTDGSSYDRDTTDSRRKRDDIAFNFMLKWKPDTLTTVTFRPNFTYSQSDMTSSSRSHTFNGLMNPVNNKVSNSVSEGESINTGGRLQAIRRMKKKGRSVSLSANLTYAKNTTENLSSSTTAFFFYNDENKQDGDSILLIDRNTNKENSSFLYRIQAAYTEPVFKNHYAQIKYTFQQRNGFSEALVYNNGFDSYIDSLSSQVDNRYNAHQIEVGLQGKHSKMNYNIGLNISPQSSESETSIGVNTGKDLKQTVVNYSPNLRFSYKFTKQHTINFSYRGQSSAPDVEYLQEVIDQTDPLNITYGNPDLTPSYKNNIRLRYGNYNSKTQRSIMANATFSNTINAITNMVVYNHETGAKETHKVNVNGNWNSSAMLTLTTPLKNRQFSISSTTSGAYANNVGYATNRSKQAIKSNTKDWKIYEKLSGNYNGEFIDFSLNASVDYQATDNNLQEMSNEETFSYIFGANTNIRLPYEFYISTDANYRLYSGFADGFKDNELIWNAQLSKNFLKNNAATVRLKIYDILRQQNSLRRTVTETMMSDTRYNTLGNYFMVYLVYRINTIGKQGANDDDDNEDYSKPKMKFEPGRTPPPDAPGGMGNRPF